MEVSKVSIQQLLRPTDTCKFIIHGRLLGTQSNEYRVLAIVQHEGTQEHVLFVFEVDSLGTLVVDKLMPIYGSFNITLQSSAPGGCNVEINNVNGEIIVFRLPYDTTTAMLFSQIKLAQNLYSSTQTSESPSAFDWLRGYEACRTGWDRFRKPQTNATSQEVEIGQGFPDNWPWGYIITPNPQGRTEVAMCESLISEFDPLSRKPSQINTSLQINIEHPSPQSSPHLPLPHSLNPFLPTGHGSSNNPFESENFSSLRPTQSETNISGLTTQDRNISPTEFHQINMTKSQDVFNNKQTNRQCIVISPAPKDSPQISPRLSPSTSLRLSPHGSIPSERPQGSHLGSSESLDNPFQSDSDQEHGKDYPVSKSVFWVDQSDSEVEMMKVNWGDGKGKEKRRGNRFEHRSGSLEVLDTKNALDGTKLDYSFRRMRSTTTGPSLSQSADYSVSSPNIPSIIKESRNQSTVQTSRVVSKSPKLFRKKIRHSPTSSPEPNRSSWVTRYQPGVLLLKGSMRECLIQRMLQEKENDFCEHTNLRLFCGTWNVNGQMPIQRVDKWLLSDDEVPNIFAIGFQELDLSTEALLTRESNREEMWIDLVECSLKQVGNFDKISCIRLVGILLVVYVEHKLVRYISDVDSDLVPCGIMGHLGNKGGVAIRFNIHHSSVCIVNSHLAAHVDEVERRNQDYHQIYSRLQFFKNTSLPYGILDHNIIVWMGDLNYRINTSQEMTADIIRAMADSYQFHTLLKHDQLHQQQKKGLIFTRFLEGAIDFKPTYKYDPSTNSWDTSEKNRAPAWCDRVLYYCKDDLLKVVNYRSYAEMIISDHKPVSALFDAMIKEVNPEKERDVLEQITWKLDKQENETLPQVEVNCLEFKFDNVKFMISQTQVLKVRNIGQRPIQLSFIPTPDKENTISKPWLSLKPERALILTDEEVSIELTVLVDSELAPLIQNNTEKLEDILVLHLDGGKDFFLSVIGTYLQSCFGSSLETLVHVHTYIREVPTADLIDLTLSSSWEEYDKNACQKINHPPALDIPKELYQLITHLNDHGLEAESLFTDGGLTAEQEKIRDILDTGGREIQGNIYSIAGSFLLFLRSLSEPVVPRSLHPRCMDACNNATLCRQILMQMSTVHRISFVYIITFLKKILEYSHINKMDAKILASIFGDILLNVSRQMRLSCNKRSLAHMSKKKATFIYQFLVNDLTVEYN